MSTELALLGGSPSRPKPIATTVHVSEHTRRRVAALLDDGLLSEYYNGPEARRVEQQFAAYHGPDRHAIAVNSGTSAIHLSLAASGVGPGDEVIVPALCFVAAATAVVQLGATPVICDVEPDTLTMDPTAAAALVGPRTKAVLPVHFWGQPADAASLRRLCDEHGLTLVEDTAQGPGATVNGKKTGTFGSFAAYSLGVRKHVACGEGGVVLTDSADNADVLRSLSNVGKGPAWDDYLRPGYSYRMVEFSAVVAQEGMARIDEEIAARRAAAQCYRDALADTALTPVPAPSWGDSVYFKLPVLLPDHALGARQFIVDAIDAENVSCRIPHRPLYAVPWLSELVAERGRPAEAAAFPAGHDAHRRLIELETGPHLPLEEAKTSAEAVLKVWRHAEDKLRADPAWNP